MGKVELEKAKKEREWRNELLKMIRHYGSICESIGWNLHNDSNEPYSDGRSQEVLELMKDADDCKIKIHNFILDKHFADMHEQIDREVFNEKAS